MPRGARRRNRAARHRLALVFALLFAPAVARPSRAACVEFTTPPAISGAPFRPTAVAAGDLDGDGDLDALVAARLDFSLAWFANEGNGSTWSLHTISTEIARPRSVQTADLDGDGDLDVLAASHYLSGGEVSWFQNDGAGGVWTRHLLSTASSQAPWSASAADFDRDGDLDVLVPLGDSSAVVWFDNAAGDGSSWVRQTIDATPGRNPVAAIAADLDGDGDDDAVAGAYVADTIVWFANDGDAGGWTATTIAPSLNGPRALATGDLDRDGDLDLLAGARAASAIVWYRNSAGDGSSWVGATVSTLAAGAYSVALADLDGDGDLDALSASVYDDEVVWHENDGAGAGWTRHTLTTGADFATAVAAGDVDGDGDLDVLAAAYLDNELSWYRNDIVHGEALFAPSATISTSGDQSVAVIAGDVDGDGDLDAVAGSYNDSEVAWYENLGGSPLAWSRHSVSTAPAPLGAFAIDAADLDRDGDLDFVTAAFGVSQIDWYENDAAGTAWVRRLITNILFNPYSLAAADLDRDGHVDVASASISDNTIAWSENDGTPLDGGWVVRTVSGTASGATSVVAADLDRDGDPDLLAALSSGDAFAWYANDGTPTDGGWVAQVITSGTAVDGAQAVRAADLDGDGDLDVVGAATNVDTLVWYANDGTPTPALWPANTVSTTIDAPTALFAADLDGDGDLDLLATAQQGNEVVWFENDGTGSGWTAHTLSTGATQARSVFAADLDGDGDLDALSTTVDTDELAWYENLGTGVFDDGFDSDANRACWSSSTP